MKPKVLLALAARMAKFDRDDMRQFRHGAVALRKDGVLVCARNGASKALEPTVHAESRVLRKAGRGATVYVVRVGRDGQWKYSRPCADCLAVMCNFRVSRVYYTIGPEEWGSLVP